MKYYGIISYDITHIRRWYQQVW